MHTYKIYRSHPLLVNQLAVFALRLFGFATIDSLHLQFFESELSKVLRHISLPLRVSECESLGREIELRHEIVTTDTRTTLDLTAAQSRQCREVSLMIELFEQYHHVAVRSRVLGWQWWHVVEQGLATLHGIARDIGPARVSVRGCDSNAHVRLRVRTRTNAPNCARGAANARGNLHGTTLARTVNACH